MAGKRKPRSDKGKKRGPQKKRSYVSRARSFYRRRKPKQRGIMGKAGAVVAGVLPVVIPTVEAGSSAMSKHKKENYSILSTVSHGILRFCNNVTVGLLGFEAFSETVTMSDKNGNESEKSIGSGLPAYSILAVIGTGLTMMATDWVASMFAGGRAVKIPLTNYNAIGSI